MSPRAAETAGLSLFRRPKAWAGAGGGGQRWGMERTVGTLQCLLGWPQLAWRGATAPDSALLVE